MEVGGEGGEKEGNPGGASDPERPMSTDSFLPLRSRKTSQQQLISSFGYQLASPLFSRQEKWRKERRRPALSCASRPSEPLSSRIWRLTSTLSFLPFSSLHELLSPRVSRVAQLGLRGSAQLDSRSTLHPGRDGRRRGKSFFPTSTSPSTFLHSGSSSPPFLADLRSFGIFFLYQHDNKYMKNKKNKSTPKQELKERSKKAKKDKVSSSSLLSLPSLRRQLRRLPPCSLLQC